MPASGLQIGQEYYMLLLMKGFVDKEIGHIDFFIWSNESL
jgi:hypothetical protein